jgi:hypothetical protein
MFFICKPTSCFSDCFVNFSFFGEITKRLSLCLLLGNPVVNASLGQTVPPLPTAPEGTLFLLANNQKIFDNSLVNMCYFQIVANIRQ